MATSMATKSAAFPHPDKAWHYDAAGLKKHWTRLHRGDCEPWPKDAAVLDAWRQYHAGEFAAAVAAGRKAGGAGINAAVKAQMIYANYLEKSAKAKLGAARRGRPLGRCAPRRGAEGSQRALPLRLCARTLQPGHLGRQGAGRRLRRQAQGRADHRAQAGAEARRRPHRLGVLSGGGDRQGRWPRRRRDLRREEGLGARALPEGAEAQPRVRDRAHRVRERADPALRQEPDGRCREALPRSRGVHAGRRDGAPRRRACEGRSWRT